MRDEVVFLDVSAGMLMALSFGCQPVSMFDTRVKFTNENYTIVNSDYNLGTDRNAIRIPEEPNILFAKVTIKSA